MHLSLYICYFGVREPLVQTQVLPYIREILKGFTEPDGYEPRIALLTFEPSRTNEDKIEFESVAKELADQGIDWHWLPYHKRPSALATAWDIFRGAIRTRSLIRLYRPAILHARVHVPALMAWIARRLFLTQKPAILFDIRGFLPEEYVDAGIWKPEGLLFRTAKRLERLIYEDTGGFVVLTEAARRELFPESAATGYDFRGRPVEVIPCCIDEKRFAIAGDSAREEMRGSLGLSGHSVIVYVGSFGGWYLSDEMVELFKVAKEQDPSTFVLILTQREKDEVAERVRKAGFLDSEFMVTSVHPDDVPKYLSAADYSVSFIKPCYSKISSSPTKNAEYLAAGLPIIANAGIGDVEENIGARRVGVIVDEFTPDSLGAAIQELKGLGNIEDRCRLVAFEDFGLELVGGRKYRRIYKRLSESMS